ncbi:hypothetical protein N9C66_10845 [Akkermansiaceae bacterium]|nr:hypothetical protein [bacterium]MDA9831822.1 hypothetical protein [Akkermansiaceae bacterium]MDB4383407.1 hypothetical protein [Akkermansiaceae bacterium]MDB4383427.1 hypothetical protein [Akkermansiaceae bacterium]MDB4809087.1 hypothetical protein [bacterium]
MNKIFIPVLILSLSLSASSLTLEDFKRDSKNSKALVVIDKKKRITKLLNPLEVKGAGVLIVLINKLKSEGEYLLLVKSYKPLSFHKIAITNGVVQFEGKGGLVSVDISHLSD